MNIVKNLIARVEDYRKETKTPCKSYATEAACEKATSEMAMKAATCFTKHNETVVSARYIVTYDEAWGRWVGFIDMSELISRKGATGGYLGVCTGFFTF